MYRPDRTEVLRLVDAAVKAPSADNVHHFRFIDAGDSLDLEVDDFFMSCTEPHRRLLTLIAYGAAVENLRLRLTEVGFTFEPRWFPDNKQGRALLRLRWSDLEPAAKADPLSSRIASRHTNRLFYQGPPLDTIQRSALDAAVPPAGPACVTWFDEAPRRRALLNLMRIAESARFQSPELHAELFESIDFEAGWKDSVPERLAPATLEVEPWMHAAFAALGKPTVMRIARLGGAHHFLGLRAAYVPAWTAPHLGVVSSTLPADEAALAVGSAFQRLWLAADEAGLALQPMVAAAILAWQGPSRDVVRTALTDRLQSEWKTLLNGVVPLVAFRLGHARHPRVVAGRRPAESYLA